MNKKMIDTNYILNELRQGVSTEDMAKSMTDALNAAQEQYNKELAEKAAASKRDEKLDELAEKIAGALNEYTAVATGIDMDKGGITAQEVRDVANELMPLANALRKAVTNDKVKVKVLKDPKDVDSVFAKFFKDFGL